MFSVLRAIRIQRHIRLNTIFSSFDQIVGNSRGNQEVDSDTNGKPGNKHPLDMLMEHRPVRVSKTEGGVMFRQKNSARARLTSMKKQLFIQATFTSMEYCLINYTH